MEDERSKGRVVVATSPMVGCDLSPGVLGLQGNQVTEWFQQRMYKKSHLTAVPTIVQPPRVDEVSSEESRSATLELVEGGPHVVDESEGQDWDEWRRKVDTELNGLA